jgi:hypothetical protein
MYHNCDIHVYVKILPGYRWKLTDISGCLSAVFDRSRRDSGGGIMGLTSRYIYGSLILLSDGAEKSISLGLSELAVYMSISRPTLNKSLKELAVLGLVSGLRTSSSKMKFFDVAVPKRAPKASWDPGQAKLIYGLLEGSIAEELGYRERMVLALLVSRSNFGGAITDSGKAKLASCLGLLERQFRSYLILLYEKGYLMGYRGGVAGRGKGVPGCISLNPKALFSYGWWHGTDLVIAERWGSGYAQWNQQRISPYLKKELAEMNPLIRTTDGKLTVSLRGQSKRIRGHSNLAVDHLYDAEARYPEGMQGQFYSTMRVMYFGSRPPHSWKDLAAVSPSQLKSIDEAFFRLSAQLVESAQGRLATEDLAKLSIRSVRAINEELMPLLTSGDKSVLSWGLRRWILQQLRFTLVRQALWTWCCLSAAYQLDLESQVGEMKVCRVYPRQRGKGALQLMWLVRFQGRNEMRGRTLNVDCAKEFTHVLIS